MNARMQGSIESSIDRIRVSIDRLRRYLERLERDVAEGDRIQALADCAELAGIARRLWDIIATDGSRAVRKAGKKASPPRERLNMFTLWT
jgi:hypothetical protein